MEANFGEIKQLTQCYGTPGPGQFALDCDPPKSPHWDHCREQFLGKMHIDLGGFYFSLPNNKSENVANFLVKFEEIVGILQFSSFRKTDKQNILWVQPNSFWLDCVLKRSLLTLVLRCGINYENNFDDALFSENYSENKYARETKNALMRFMYGFTRYVGCISSNIGNSWDGSSTLVKHGWHTEFENAEVQTVRRKLNRPLNENYEPIIIGIESLWA